jgi:xylan 1,4-beta-xylosidase
MDQPTLINAGFTVCGINNMTHAIKMFMNRTIQDLITPRKFLSVLCIWGIASQVASAASTFCNPLDLPYHFQLDKPVRREAADPTMVAFKGEWWLFASKSGGYWHTADFATWKFVEPAGLPLEDYAPTAEIIDGRLCFSSGHGAIYTTDDPAVGNWVKLSGMHGAGDIDLFADDDGRVYVYYGCSDKTPIWGEELDPKQGFKTIQGPVNLISGKPAEHGWEIKREPRVTKDIEAEMQNPKFKPYIEGAWMTKVNGRYYLQYAAPGTELDGYGDGVYVGEHPLGPFTYQPSNPFSFRPTGFARGAGHSSTFQDAKGNYWHIGTITIARRAMFERRLGIFPMKFFPDGQVACNTCLGDYPQYLPGVAANPFESNSPGWMLLSLNKPAEASSSLDGFPVNQAFDETIKTWWSAATGNSNEWLKVDLGSVVKIQAIQINFADEGATNLGRLRDDAYRYIVEVSNNGKKWRTFLDKKDNLRDAPHDYAELSQPVTGRYVRLTNLHTPAGARFSVSDLRVFGKANGSAPAAVSKITALREAADGRRASISWEASKGAEFYIVRYGVRPDRLYTDFQVYDATSLDLRSLNAGVTYYVTVDAISASGITRGPTAIPIQ